MRRFEIWLAQLPEKADENSHVQTGQRPVLIVSNDTVNLHSPVVTIVPLTSNQNKKPIPTHVELWGQGLRQHSLALCEQITDLDKTRLFRYLGFVGRANDQHAINRAMSIQLGMAM